MYTATKILKIAPKSAPSLTPIPTANPANPTLHHAFTPAPPDSAASAKKHIPIVITGAPTPQHAAEKKLEFKTAASAPSRQAQLPNPICRKKHHAPRPKIISDAGAYNFENQIGPRIHCRLKVIFGTALASR